MATLTQSNVTFTLNADVVSPFGGKYTNDMNFDADTGRYNVDQTKLNSLGVGKSVNAVEIDWNGAKLGIGEDNSTGITTTGELLKLIKKYADTKRSEAIDYVQGTDDDTSSDDTIWGTKKYADEAVSTVKGELIGTSTDASTADTIYGAKKYTDTKIAKLQNRVDALEAALSTLAQNVGSLVTIANG